MRGKAAKESVTRPKSQSSKNSNSKVEKAAKAAKAGKAKVLRKKLTLQNRLLLRKPMHQRAAVASINRLTRVASFVATPNTSGVTISFTTIPNAGRVWK